MSGGTLGERTRMAERDALEVENLRLTLENQRLRGVLAELAAEDFRGPEPVYRRIARRALGDNR